MLDDAIDQRPATRRHHLDKQHDGAQASKPQRAGRGGRGTGGGGGGRRWPRRVLIGLNVLVATCLVAAALVYGYVRYRTSQLKTAKCPSCVAAPGAGGLGPMNILLIGSNTRTGLEPSEANQFGSGSQVPGARSDVTMIVHLDPASGTASLLSIPRDLFVPLPPHSLAGGVGKIDAALNDGPDNLIAAITNDLGIPINHYVEVNFDGFRRTIDAIGGIKMDFPTELRDPLSGLRITHTGCQQLNGTVALAVVRARHLQYLAPNGRWADDPLSDLARIRRDHTFLRIFVTAAKAQVTNPIHLNSLVGGLLNQVTVDSGLNVHTFLELFRHYRHLDPNVVPETTLPITVVSNYHFAGGTYGDVDMPVEPLDHQVIEAWQGQPLPSASPASTAVKVVNISGTYRKAATIADGLSAAGYQVTGSTTGIVPALTDETVINYAPGSVEQALGLLAHLSGAVMLHPDPTVPAGTLTLEVGSVVDVVTPSTPPTGASTPGGTTSGGTTSGGTTSGVSTPTTVPTALHEAPSSSQDQPQPFDPTACPPGT